MSKRKAENNIIIPAKKCKATLEQIDADAAEYLVENVEIKICEASQMTISSQSNLFEYSSESQRTRQVIKIKRKMENRYGLRSRHKIPLKSPVKSPANKEPVTTKVACKALQIVRNVKQIKIKDNTFNVGEVVLARLKGYPPWPGVIKEISGSHRLQVVVRFFGDDTRYFFFRLIK